MPVWIRRLYSAVISSSCKKPVRFVIDCLRQGGAAILSQKSKGRNLSALARDSIDDEVGLCPNIGTIRLLSKPTGQGPPLRIVVALELAGLGLDAEAGFHARS